MNVAKLLTREEFRTKVFERDHYRCVFCKADAVDAHHIMERRLWDDGGYYLENGASVCTPCHILCEKTYYSTADVRKATGITRILLPDHFYDDQEFDKWGNPVMPNGQRLRGELFYDGSVQKIMADYLHLFTKYIKYPRTFHLPWSDGMHDDDRMMPDVKIFEGKRVIVMEKMDGECLLASTKITMSDFSKINIRDIYKNKIIGQHVLGVNQRGEIVPSKILNVFFNGVTEEWLSVNVKGQHGPYVKIICTPNHKFNVNDNYIEAKNMKGGDMVKIIDYSPDLTSIQEQILLGMLLGDASIHNVKDHGCKNVNKMVIQFSHKKEHLEYIEWINKRLGDIARQYCFCTSGFGSTMIKCWTASSNSIFNSFNSMIVNGKKIVPNWVIEKITPLSLAFWYMDDGNLLHNFKQRDRAQFSVCGFDRESCLVLQQCLEKFGINSVLEEYKNYLYLRLFTNDSERFFELISPHIPPCMQYKLPEKLRGKELTIPKVEHNISVPRLREVEVKSVEKYLHNTNRGKYDIETETHNYFANGVLVHNCTTMYNDYIHARSIDSGSHGSRNWIKAFHGQMCNNIPDDWRINVENVYAKHSIFYKNLPTYAYGFALWNEKNYLLDWMTSLEWFELLGITPCPWFYWDTYDRKKIHSLYEELSKDHETEGYVIRVDEPFHYGQFRTHVGKFVRKGHIQTTKHWAYGQKIEPNILKEGVTGFEALL